MFPVKFNLGNEAGAKAAILAHAPGTLVQETEHTLVFSGQMNTGQELLTRVALGSAYSSQPTFIRTFTIVPLSENSTKVTGHIAIDMRNVFGGQQGMSLDQGKAGHQLQEYLESMRHAAESRLWIKRHGEMKNPRS